MQFKVYHIIFYKIPVSGEPIHSSALIQNSPAELTAEL
jgi:hypothetical protein